MLFDFTGVHAEIWASESLWWRWMRQMGKRRAGVRPGNSARKRLRLPRRVACAPRRAMVVVLLLPLWAKKHLRSRLRCGCGTRAVEGPGVQGSTAQEAGFCGRDEARQASEGCGGERGEGRDAAGGCGLQDCAAGQCRGRCGHCACAAAEAAGARGWAPGAGAGGGCRVVRFGSVREAALVVQCAAYLSAAHRDQQEHHMQQEWQEQQQQQQREKDDQWGQGQRDQLLPGRSGARGAGGAAGTFGCGGREAGVQLPLELPLQQRLQAALGALEGWAAGQGGELWRQLPAWVALGSMV